MAITKTARTSTARTNALAQLDDDVIEFDALKAQASELADRIKELQGKVIDNMETLGIDSHVVENGDAKVQVTRVQNTSTTLDETRFRKLIGTSVWNKVSSRKLDKAKLDDAIKNGVVAPIDVADASNEKTGSPFIRLTRKK